MWAQTFHNRAITARSLLAQRLAHRARKLITSRIDPTVKINVCGTQLLAPLSHDLPFYQRFHPRYALSVGVLAKLVHERHPQGTMIDIGANIGDTVAIVRGAAPDMPVLCIEGNPEFARLLQLNVRDLGDVEVARTILLSDHAGIITGSFSSEGSTAEFREDGAAPVPTTTLDELLREHPRFASPALLKSDTDGFEARVIAGASETLRRARPVLFLEYEPEILERAGTDGLTMLESLRELGYGPAVIYDSFGVPICLASLGGRQLLAGLDQYVRMKQYYLDLAVFSEDAGELAKELYKRETGRSSDP